jgi:hypothetical protein
MALIIVMTESCDTDLNSENIKGNKQIITTKVVLITALPVLFTTKVSASTLLKFRFL